MTWQEQAALQLRLHVPTRSRLLVAVSGGPDSVVLAHFLRRQPYALLIGHIDHRLRTGSAHDSRFVQRLARHWDIPCVVKSVDVAGHARRRHLGIEEAARDCRYRALSMLARQNRCAAIVTAHTADDQAETVLMNFLRGAGPAGLAGMPSVRHLPQTGRIPIVRPLLDIRRRQILHYLKQYSLASRQDPTNRSMRFMRNRIRHAVLPSLERLYPGLGDRLAQSAGIFRGEEEFWQDHMAPCLRQTIRKNGRKITVVLPRLLRYHKALSRRILRHILPGLSFQDIEQVLTLAQSPERSAWLKLAEGRRIRRENNRLVVG